MRKSTLLMCCGVLAPWLLLSAAHAANHNVRIRNFSYDPQELTVAPGDTVTWTNEAGTHDVIADDNSFNSGMLRSGTWTLNHTFTSPGAFPYYCSAHGGRGGQGMAGRIVVGAPAGGTFQINEGVQGSWFNPATAGQGFFFDVSPGAQLFAVAWFTWSQTAGVYDWYTAVGNYTGTGADVTISRTRGGRFNDSTAVTTTNAGTGRVQFTSCSSASFQFTLTDPAATGNIPLTRLLPPSAQCTSVNPTVQPVVPDPGPYN